MQNYHMWFRDTPLHQVKQNTKVKIKFLTFETHSVPIGSLHSKEGLGTNVCNLIFHFCKYIVLVMHCAILFDRFIENIIVNMYCAVRYYGKFMV